MLATALLSAAVSASTAASSSSLLPLSQSSSAMTTTTAASATTTNTPAAALTSSLTTSSGEQQVRALIPVTTSDGGKLFVSGPCIVLKTQTSAVTVAQQMQALWPLRKADSNNARNVDSGTTVGSRKKTNDTNNNNNNNNNNSISGSDNNNTKTKIRKITLGKGLTKAVNSGPNSENEPEALRCKRRIDFSSLGLPKPHPVAMARRNERERNRVKQVNLGFETLRQHVPPGRKNKKLSKVDTLKEAVKYIRYLHQLLVEADGNDDEDDDGLTTSISDTITMVSRPTASTTASYATTNDGSVSPSSPAPADVATSTAFPLLSVKAEPSSLSSSSCTRSAMTPAAMDTADFDGMDLAPLAADSAMKMSPSAAMDFDACETAGSLADLDSINPSSMVHMDSTASAIPTIVDFVDHDVSDANNDFANIGNLSSANSMDTDHHPSSSSSSSHFVELAPAQLNFDNHKSPSSLPVSSSSPPSSSSSPSLTSSSAASAMDVEHIRASIDPATELPMLSTLQAAANAFPLTFLDLHHGGNPPAANPYSEECLSPAEEGRNTQAHGALSEFHSLRTTRVCSGGGGSDGSCPVSPSDSEVSQEEGSMGVYGGETWQDLSADIADWLCSKIDIGDPDVFAREEGRSASVSFTDHHIPEELKNVV